METSSSCNRTLKAFALASAIFLAIAVISIAFMFSPVKVVTEYDVFGESIKEETASSALSIQGAALLGESWKKYPDYTIGLGIAAGLAFGGYIFCIIMIDKEMREARKAEL